jgi:formylglycine-generating enzyme required for sulfatase activity
MPRGGWSGSPGNSRAANRNRKIPDNRNDYKGLRVVAPPAVGGKL